MQHNNNVPNQELGSKRLCVQPNHPLFYLPYELLLLIFSYFSPKELLLLSRLTRWTNQNQQSWKKCLRDDHVWKKQFQQRIDHLYDDPTDKMIIETFPVFNPWGYCDISLMPNEGGRYNVSSKNNLYLYKNTDESIFYYIEESNQPQYLKKLNEKEWLKEAPFDPSKCDNKKIVMTILNITSKRGHTYFWNSSFNNSPNIESRYYRNFKKEFKNNILPVLKSSVTHGYISVAEAQSISVVLKEVFTITSSTTHYLTNTNLHSLPQDELKNLKNKLHKLSLFIKNLRVAISPSFSEKNRKEIYDLLNYYWNHIISYKIYLDQIIKKDSNFSKPYYDHKFHSDFQRFIEFLSSFAGIDIFNKLDLTISSILHDENLFQKIQFLFHKNNLLVVKIMDEKIGIQNIINNEEIIKKLNEKIQYVLKHLSRIELLCIGIKKHGLHTHIRTIDEFNNLINLDIRLLYFLCLSAYGEELFKHAKNKELNILDILQNKKPVILLLLKNIPDVNNPFNILNFIPLEYLLHNDSKNHVIKKLFSKKGRAVLINKKLLWDDTKKNLYFSQDEKSKQNALEMSEKDFNKKFKECFDTDGPLNKKEKNYTEQDSNYKKQINNHNRIYQILSETNRLLIEEENLKKEESNLNTELEKKNIKLPPEKDENDKNLHQNQQILSDKHKRLLQLFQLFEQEDRQRENQQISSQPSQQHEQNPYLPNSQPTLLHQPYQPSLFSVNGNNNLPMPNRPQENNINNDHNNRNSNNTNFYYPNYH